VLKPSDLAERPDFRRGPLVISPAQRTVEGPQGALHLEPLIARVFLMLLDAGGAVVTREALLHECWAGEVHSDNSLNRSITMVRRIASTTCPGVFEIKNVPRTGYLLTGALLEYPAEALTVRPCSQEPDRPALLFAPTQPDARALRLVTTAMLLVAL
jgi:DNA-binding winged helix-turn-helix (wHTH) protein